jgi:NADPH2:quinone reductase
MRAFVASAFTGFEALQLQEVDAPIPGEDRLLVRVVAAGVNVVDHSILFGKMPMVAAPLILGNEGAGVVEQGDAEFPTGTRVVFGGPFGVLEAGAYAEFVAVPKSMLYRVPGNIDLVEAAGLPVAYISAWMALEMAGFQAGQVVFAPGVFGGIGNATLQLARALGARLVVSSTGSPGKAAAAMAAGFGPVIDFALEPLANAILRLTDDHGVDVVVDGLSGPVLTSALEMLAPRGAIVTVGYSAGREAAIDVTNLIWKSARILGFNFLFEDVERRATAWRGVSPLLAEGRIKPVVARVFPFEQTAEAMRFLVEDRPSGRVIIAM